MNHPMRPPKTSRNQQWDGFRFLLLDMKGWMDQIWNRIFHILADHKVLVLISKSKMKPKHSVAIFAFLGLAARKFPDTKGESHSN